MKTANEILLEAVHLKESGGAAEPGMILALLTDLARIVVELELQRGAPVESRPEAAPADPA